MLDTEFFITMSGITMLLLFFMAIAYGCDALLEFIWDTYEDSYEYDEGR